MKRADLSHLDRVLWFIPTTALAALAMADLAQAQSARFTLIDARNGLTPAVQAAYAEAMGASTETPHIKSRVKIIASPKYGAAFNVVDLPENIRSAELSIDLILQGASPLKQPIDLNHIRFARHAPRRVAQTTTIRGH